MGRVSDILDVVTHFNRLFAYSLMLLGFKTELKLNNQQRIALIKHCGVARHAWNWGLALTLEILDHNKTNPDSKIKFPTAIDLHKWLVALVKSENEWYYECSKSTPQQALKIGRAHV